MEVLKVLTGGNISKLLWDNLSWKMPEKAFLLVLDRILLVGPDPSVWKEVTVSDMTSGEDAGDCPEEDEAGLPGQGEEDVAGPDPPGQGEEEDQEEPPADPACERAARRAAKKAAQLAAELGAAQVCEEYLRDERSTTAQPGSGSQIDPDEDNNDHKDNNDQRNNDKDNNDQHNNDKDNNDEDNNEQRSPADPEDDEQEIEKQVKLGLAETKRKLLQDSPQLHVFLTKLKVDGFVWTAAFMQSVSSKTTEC